MSTTMHNAQRIDTLELESLRLDLDRAIPSDQNSSENTCVDNGRLPEDDLKDPNDKDNSAPLFYAAIDSARGTGPAHITNEPLRDAAATIAASIPPTPLTRSVREVMELPPYIQPQDPKSPSSSSPIPQHYYSNNQTNNNIIRPVGIPSASRGGSYNRQIPSEYPQMRPSPATSPPPPPLPHPASIQPQHPIGIFPSMPQHTIQGAGRSQPHSRVMGSIAVNPVLQSFTPSIMPHSAEPEGLPARPRWEMVEDQNRGLDKKIFVGGLHYSTTDDDLKDFFESQFGPVLEAHTVKNREGQSRGFGFIIFQEVESRYRAVASDSVDCFGARVDIRAATPPASHASPQRGAASWHRMAYDESAQERNQHELWRSVGSSYRRPVEYARERSPPVFYPSFYPSQPNSRVLRDDELLQGGVRSSSNWRRNAPQHREEGEPRDVGPVDASAVLTVKNAGLPTNASSVNCVEFQFVDEE